MLTMGRISGRGMFPVVPRCVGRYKDDEDRLNRSYTGRLKIMAESTKSDSLRLASISSVPARTLLVDKALRGRK
jgi:hypothetical protein